VRLLIRGHDLPGRRCGPYDDVHVGLQVGRSPEGLVRGDAAEAEWVTDVRVLDTADGPDFRGPAVQGRRGDRFVYLTWGTMAGGSFEMFRRAKLMLADLPSPPLDTAQVVADVHLTDDQGMPRCARLREPALTFAPATMEER
jgi:hypothetical protein